MPAPTGDSIGRVEEMGYVSVPFDFPRSSTSGKSSRSYAWNSCSSSRSMYCRLRDALVALSEQVPLAAVVGVDVQPDGHREADAGDGGVVRENPRIRRVAGHDAPPELDELRREQFLGHPSVLLIGDVVRLVRGHDVGHRLSGREELVERAAGDSPLWAVGENHVLGGDVFAVGQPDGVSRRTPQVGLDAGDADADAVVRARFRRPFAEPVVEPRPVERDAEAVGAGTDTGLCERHLRRGAVELRPVEFAQHNILGELRPWNVHDVEPVIEQPGGVRRVRPRPLAVGSGDPFSRRTASAPWSAAASAADDPAGPPPTMATSTCSIPATVSRAR